MPFLLRLINELGLTTPRVFSWRGGLQTKGAAPPSRPPPPQGSSGSSLARVTHPVSSTPSPALASCPRPGWPCPGHRSSSGPSNPCFGAAPPAGPALQLRGRVLAPQSAKVHATLVCIAVKAPDMKSTLPTAFFKCLCMWPPRRLATAFGDFGCGMWDRTPAPGTGSVEA